MDRSALLVVDMINDSNPNWTIKNQILVDGHHQIKDGQNPFSQWQAVTSFEDKVVIEVHDSGPGLSEQARKSLFQPTISFKKRGTGLGLSIARKSALLSGGDILLVKGELGGAGFRVLLPVIPNGNQAHPDRG